MKQKYCAFPTFSYPLNSLYLYRVLGGEKDSFVTEEQQSMRREEKPTRGMCASRKRDAAAYLFLNAQPAGLHLTPTTNSQALHTISGNSIHIV